MSSRAPVHPAQPQGLLEQRQGLFVLVGGAGLGDQVAELVQVHGLAVHGEQISTGTAVQADFVVGGTQCCAQPGQVVVDGFASPCGWLFAPDAVKQLIGGNEVIGLYQQRCQHGALPGMPDIDRHAVDPSLDAPQYPEFDHCHNSHVVSPHMGIAGDPVGFRLFAQFSHDRPSIVVPAGRHRTVERAMIDSGLSVEQGTACKRFPRWPVLEAFAGST